LTICYHNAVAVKPHATCTKVLFKIVKHAKKHYKKIRRQYRKFRFIKTIKTIRIVKKKIIALKRKWVILRSSFKRVSHHFPGSKKAMILRKKIAKCIKKMRKLKKKITQSRYHQAQNQNHQNQEINQGLVN